MSLLNFRFAVVLSAAAVGLLSAGLAQAHPEVRWAVNVATPPVAVQLASDRGHGVAVPVVDRYGRPVYPAYPVYREPTRWDRDADGIPDRYESHHRHHRHFRDRWERCEEREPDRDRDGVPDRYDRRPHDPYRW
ncbi:hypothetical protein [Pelomonas sp. SE-A7]|uniref:hypothetical protein n=1 Tax=Pelomonas sp. SE-A7 TaxID=3054953 RepID=UPI00259D025A|nr:hypothetical protein [Pelomonas sp. SE-A7]MDM4768418.1 hypothetical protein [Pelomonas sp. SE-A7]